MKPPGIGEIQRRCWTITEVNLEVGQCWLFNGHPGDHLFHQPAQPNLRRSPTMADGTVGMRRGE